MFLGASFQRVGVVLARCLAAVSMDGTPRTAPPASAAQCGQCFLDLQWMRVGKHGLCAMCRRPCAPATPIDCPPAATPHQHLAGCRRSLAPSTPTHLATFPVIDRPANAAHRPMPIPASTRSCWSIYRLQPLNSKRLAVRGDMKRPPAHKWDWGVIGGGGYHLEMG